MSKAILIINTPNKCNECPICASWQASASSIREYWCPAAGNKDVDPKGKPNWCPLSALPEKQVRDYPEYDKYITGYDDGWDACIDEILGE